MMNYWMGLVVLCALLGSGVSKGQSTVATTGGTANTIPKFSESTTLVDSAITESNGNVGIGTTTPDVIFDAVGVTRFELTPSTVYNSPLMNTGNINDVIRINAPYSENPSSGANAGAAWGIRFIGTTDNSSDRNTQAKGPGIFAVSEDFLGWNRMNGLAFYTNSMDTAAAERVRISSGGNVGIGTASPGSKLEVNGNVKLTSGSGASLTFADGTVQSTAWTGSLCGGDYAESVDVSGERTQYEPGDVLVIDPSHPGQFLKSSTRYSRFVAGIYSTKPGLVGRRQTTDPMTSKTEIPMAMVGIVPTKVTDENGPIEVGDLLVTSSRPAHAMKGGDGVLPTGTVIGKALGSLISGTGVIEVLVSLQ